MAAIRIIDVSQFLPGPFAAQVLADMGADVLKVEPPNGDPMRSLNPVSNQRGKAPFHKSINAGKNVVRIDLKSASGKNSFCDLISKADILIESYRPGVLARLGMGYDVLCKINPGLIHCALSGYGQSGPLKNRSGHDINYLAMSGGLNVTGPSGKPQPAFPPVADYGGAMQAVIAIQNALLERMTSGQGAYLDVAMSDTMVSWQTFGLIQDGLSRTGDGQSPKRSTDLLNGGAACYQVYQTRDNRFISLGAIEVVFWENFCRAVGHVDWIERQSEALPQFALINEVERLFVTQDRSHWDHIFDDVDCCYHPVLAYGELAEWPQIVDRALLDFDRQSGQFQGVRNPVWKNHKPPQSRPPMRDILIDEALQNWA